MARLNEGLEPPAQRDHTTALRVLQKVPKRKGNANWHCQEGPITWRPRRPIDARSRRQGQSKDRPRRPLVPAVLHAKRDASAAMISFDTHILVYATASISDVRVMRARDLVARAMRTSSRLNLCKVSPKAGPWTSHRSRVEWPFCRRACCCCSPCGVQ